MKRSGIFPRVLESIYPVIRPLTFSDICRILNIVAPYIQQIVSMFWITPPVGFNLRQDRLFILKKKQPPLNQQVRHKKVKLSLCFSHLHALLHFVATIHHIKHFFTCYRFCFQLLLFQSTEDDSRFCRNRSLL